MATRLKIKNNFIIFIIRCHFVCNKSQQSFIFVSAFGFGFCYYSFWYYSLFFHFSCLQYILFYLLNCNYFHGYFCFRFVFAISPFYSNILIYPLNIHLHVASNFACVRHTFLIFIYMYVTLFPLSVHTYVWECVPNVCTLCYVWLPHKYLSTVYSLFIWYMLVYLQFWSVNSARLRAIGSQWLRTTDYG